MKHLVRRASDWLIAAGHEVTLILAMVVATIGGLTRNPYALGVALVVAIASGSGLIAEALRMHALATIAARRKGRR